MIDMYMNIMCMYMNIVIFQFEAMDASANTPWGPIGSPPCIPGQVRTISVSRHCGSGVPWWEGSGSV